jgi:hypothetical protein
VREEGIPSSGEPQLRAGIGEIGVGLDACDVCVVGIPLCLKKVELRCGAGPISLLG